MNESEVGRDWEIKIIKELLNHVSIYYLSDPLEGTSKIWIIQVWFIHVDPKFDARVNGCVWRGKYIKKSYPVERLESTSSVFASTRCGIWAHKYYYRLIW